MIPGRPAVQARRLRECDAAVRPAGSHRAWLRALELTAPIPRAPHRVLPTVIEELAAHLDAAPALLSERESLTYRALAERSSRYARWALEHGVGTGDAVALFMPNRPEYLAIWLGVTRVGGVVALLNTHLAGASLARCIDLVAPRHIIVAGELIEPFMTALPHLAGAATIWLHGAGPDDFPRIDLDVERRAGEPLGRAERRPPTIEDRALYIYTSGTTGLPKAAGVSHFRLMQWSHWFAGLMDVRGGDRMYDCLPMYHSVGGVVAPGAALVGGASVVLREKFSARDFWSDVVRWDCTLFQYIGELCRYLLHAEPTACEVEHRIRLCCGNGLRPDVWEAFKRRFGIPRILEFYAATEGNVSLFNVDGKPGAIGRIPPFLAHRFPAALVRFDVAREAPARDAQGRCIRCGTNEVGEAIGKILEDPSNPGRRFEAYTSAAASEQKILRDVFEPGDAWFRTGDLMRRDEDDDYYFVDRIGDTFRWKGENVATLEVAEAICAFPGIREASVYGVAVPGADGRAGMAAVVPDAGLDLGAFRAHLADRLPGYARPLFLRIRSELDVTTTFKHAKDELVRQAYDPSASADVVYFDDPERGAFVELDPALYRRIQTGGIRL
jgi:fatty-acyl-CoA synthase